MLQSLTGTAPPASCRPPLANKVVLLLVRDCRGRACGVCDGTASGKPIASALTDASGKFVLENPPVGKDIPLVLQVGK